MMKYLARTSSDSDLSKVLHQNALYEGSLGERRRREGKLRTEQERLEGEVTSQMHAFASTLQAGAQAKALAQARAAANGRTAAAGENPGNPAREPSLRQRDRMLRTSWSVCPLPSASQ